MPDMGARLFAFVLAYLMIGLATLGVVYRLISPRLNKWLAERRKLAIGRENARRVLQEFEKEACLICGKPTYFQRDMFDPSRGWFHTSCWKSVDKQLTGSSTHSSNGGLS